MALNISATSLRNLLNSASPGQLATLLDLLNFGDVLRGFPVWIRRDNPNAAVTNPYIKAGQGVSGPVQGGTGSTQLNSQLPDDAKCAFILRATAIAGTGTLGELTIDSIATNNTNFATAGTGPAAGHIGISPSGDIVTNATDAFTSIDVLYLPEQQDVFEVIVSPASGVATIPAGILASGVTNLLEAEILTGTNVGKCAVLPPTNSVTTTTLQAALNLAKGVVNFRVADAPTSVRLKLGVVRNGYVAQNANVTGFGQGVDLNTILGLPSAVRG